MVRVVEIWARSEFWVRTEFGIVIYNIKMNLLFHIVNYVLVLYIHVN